MHVYSESVQLPSDSVTSWLWYISWALLLQQSDFVLGILCFVVIVACCLVTDMPNNGCWMLLYGSEQFVSTITCHAAFIW